MSHEAAFDVAIIGGGLIGCAIAHRLASRGLDVCVIERGEPGAEASAAAGGMLSPLAEAEQAGPFLDLALTSLDRFPAFVEQIEEASGLDVDYDRTSGKLHIALNDPAAGKLRERLEWQRRAGFEVELLEGDDARRIEPALSPTVLSALLLHRDHRVDNRLLGHAAWLAAARVGARFRLGASAIGVTLEGGGTRASGVRLAQGDAVAAGQVVVAAGAWSAQLDGLPRPLPVFPVRGQMVAVESVPPLLGHVVHSTECYLVPRSTGRLVIGSTMERAGFRREVTAGAVHRLIAAAFDAVPSVADAAFADAWMGFRPGTPDELPILGEDPEVQGLHYATGHFRNGILLAPITAELLAASVTDETPSLDMRPFAPDRFRSADGHP